MTKWVSFVLAAITMVFALSTSAHDRSLYLTKTSHKGDAVLSTCADDELRALRRLRREYAKNPFIFVTERSGPLTRSIVNKLVARAGQKAEMEFPVHPHMLRHACGYYLANKGIDTRTIQDYLGHVPIIHTVRYTELSPNKFKGLWA